ncbi:Gly-Xaa carboxypeptidase [Asimina triloba]
MEFNSRRGFQLALESGVHERTKQAAPQKHKHDDCCMRRSETKTTVAGGQGLMTASLETLRHLSVQALVADGCDVYSKLLRAVSCNSSTVDVQTLPPPHFLPWEAWLVMASGGEGFLSGTGAAELLVHVINLCAGRCGSEELLLSHPHYSRLASRTNAICDRLRPRMLRARQVRNASLDGGIISL